MERRHQSQRVTFLASPSPSYPQVCRFRDLTPLYSESRPAQGLDVPYALSSTSACIRAISSSSFIAPRSSPLRRRTAAASASASRSPTTSM